MLALLFTTTLSYGQYSSSAIQKGSEQTSKVQTDSVPNQLQEIVVTANDFDKKMAQSFKNVELKGENTAIPTATILKQYLSDSQSDIKKLIVSSKNWKELTLFKNLGTNIPIGVLSNYNIFLEKGLNDIIKKGKELNAIAIHPKFSILNKKAIDRMHAAGFLVYSWTINREKDIKRAIALGIDGIITDFPDRIPD